MLFLLFFFLDGYVTVMLDVLCCGDKGGVGMFVPSTRAMVGASLSRYCAIKLKWTKTAEHRNVTIMLY